MSRLPELSIGLDALAATDLTYAATFGRSRSSPDQSIGVSWSSSGGDAKARGGVGLMAGRSA